MSNAMSSSKSRLKGALLAAVAGAIVSPMAAQATMTIDLSLQPLGSTSPYSLVYVNPDMQTIPVYVYATITGSAAPGVATTGSTAPSSTGDFDGLQYAYYNVVNAGANPVGGNFSAGTLNAALGFNATGADISGNTGGGAQVGTLQNIVGGVSVGMTTSGSMTDFAKPRAAQPVWSNAASYNPGTNTYTSLADGTNIVTAANGGAAALSANSVTFLLETLSFTPSSAGGNFTAFNPSTPSSVVTTTFSTSIPTLSGVQYAPANIFTDSTSSAPPTPASLKSVTTSAYSSGASVTLTNDIKGDANGDGVVNIFDFNILVANFNKVGGWAQGNFEEATYTVVNIFDFNDLVATFNKNIGPNPSAANAPLYAFALAHNDLSGFIAAGGVVPGAAVPEPATMGLVALSGAALLSRRSRRTIG